jgi:glycerophosphoryl diester phosphodiesterase
MKPYLVLEHPLRFAHRGSRVLWPENTMVAFQGAIDLGYKYIETDLHVSRDGKVVIFHDDTLERLTNGVGRFWDLEWENLRTLDAGHHFDPAAGHPWRGRGAGMPLLEEAVRTFPATNFNLDLKQPGIEGIVAREVRRLGVEDRVLIGSFYDLRVRRVRAAAGDQVATAAGPGEVLRALAAARAHRKVRGTFDALQVPERIATRRLVEAAHRGGKQVHVWTVNDPAAMRRLLDLGVDGIVSDRPDLLNEVVLGS